MSHRMLGHLNPRNWSARIVAIFLYRTAPNMAKISYNSNANSVVPQLNGSVGETPTFVNPATKGNATETT